MIRTRPNFYVKLKYFERNTKFGINIIYYRSRKLKTNTLRLAIRNQNRYPMENS